jgi:hypothetical protein
MNDSSGSGSINKVMAAGFRAFRVHPQMKKITEAAGPGRWKTFGTYTSEAETWRQWKLLMQEPKNITM